MQKFSSIIVFIGLIVILAINSLFILDQRQQALILQFGEPRRMVVAPGLTFKVPFIQNVLLFDKRIQNLYADTSEVIALDQKTMRVDAFVKYQITDTLKFYQAAQNEVKFKARLDTILDSSLRQVLGSKPFKALLSDERAGIMRSIRDLVNNEAKSFGVAVLDVRISRADLPDKSREAVSRRMRTDREKEAREIRASGAAEAEKIMATADKDKVIIVAEAREAAEKLRGEGDAEALKIFNEAVGRDPEFFDFFRSMRVYQKTITPDDTVMVLSPDNKFMRHLN
ncbi:MAG: protease modulator HflC [Proteobacteria bacterium]|nr:protease modulator HflC [Pseudomonadota bacterium]